MKRIVLSFGIIILLAGGGIFAYYTFEHKNQAPQNLVTVSRDTITQEVVATGTTKTDQNVALAFQKEGRVSTIAVHVGDHVKKDDPLITLDASELESQERQVLAAAQGARAQLLQYEATLESQQARLDELNRGSTKEELALAQTKIVNAQGDSRDANNALQAAMDTADRSLEKWTKSIEDATVSLKDAQSSADLETKNLYDGVKDILNDAYSKSYDAVYTQTQPFFGSYVNVTNPSLNINTLNTTAKNRAEFQRTDAYSAVADMKAHLAALRNDSSSLDDELINFNHGLVLIRNSLFPLSDVLSATPDLAATTLATYKANVTTATQNMNGAIAAITNRQQQIATQLQQNETNIHAATMKLNEAQKSLELQKATNASSLSAAQAKITAAHNTLEIAQNEYAIKKSGTPVEQIREQLASVKQARATITAQQAQIASADAQVEFYKTQIAHTILLSPIQGVVSSIIPKEGETVSANTPAVTLLSDQALDIEVHIPEGDITKVAITNPVVITFDALPGESFSGRVLRIDPAETIIDGVVNFKVTIVFDATNPRVRTGYTANVAIQTASHANALAIPQFAIQENDKGHIVKRYRNGTIEDVTVTTGLHNTKGMVEILSGLQEGDMIINIGLKSKTTQ